MAAEARRGAERDRDQAIDLTRLGAGVRRRRRWMVLSTLAAVSSAFVFVMHPRHTGVDPELAARGISRAAQAYVQPKTEAEATAADAGLAKRIDELRARIADADAKVESLRAQSVLLPGAKGGTVSQPLYDLNGQISGARSAEAAASAKAELLRNLERAGRLDDAPASIADESMRRFLEQRVALKAEIADASRALLPLHPHMKELTAQLAALDARIRDAAAKNVRVFENDARLAGAQVASLSATLADENKTVAAGDAYDARLRTLEMEAKSARDQLEAYLEKDGRAPARDTRNSAPADARIIAAVEPPRSPTFSKAWQTVLLASLAGLLVSAGAAATLASGETKPHPMRSAEPGAESPALAPLLDEGHPQPQTPHLAEPNGQEREAKDGDERRLSIVLQGSQLRLPSEGLTLSVLESAEALAESLSLSGDRLIALIAGDTPGRALAIAVATARRLAEEGATLLVDLGATEAWLADILNREETDEAEIPGLSDILSGKAGFGDVIRRDLSSSLDVIASGGNVPAETLEEVFAALATAYQRLILHSSDWRSAPARAAAGIADAIVVVAPKARLQQAVAETREALADDGVEVFGFAARLPTPMPEEFEAGA